MNKEDTNVSVALLRSQVSTSFCIYSVHALMVCSQVVFIELCAYRHCAYLSKIHFGKKNLHAVLVYDDVYGEQDAV